MIDLRGPSERLSETEKAARLKLQAGCSSDLEELARFLEAPLNRARRAIASSPQDAQQIAAQCASEISANVDDRFFTRFAMYADALAYAQIAFLKAAHAAAGVELDAPRRIAIPTIELVLAQDAALEEIGPAVEPAVRNVLELVLSRGARSIARSRISVRRVLRGLGLGLAGL
jgi:hypothetical protein